MTQTVLIIDDCPDVHRLIEYRLQAEELEVHSATTGEEGIAIARRVGPDLVLLDISLPGLHGLEVCRRLKEDIGTASIPVIFMTAANQTFMKVEAFDLGAVDYITKPIEPVEMRARIRAALRTKRYHDLLEVQAQIDGLTGLRNRRCFDERLVCELAAAGRYGRVVSLVLIDLDHFKSVNDRFGHPFGDRVLRQVSVVVMGTIRSVDVACRYGGEELAVILTETDLDGAVTVGERIRTDIERLVLVHGGQRVPVTSSLGVASSEHLSTLSSAAILHAADVALYEAKRMGRNQVRSANVQTIDLVEPAGQ